MNSYYIDGISTGDYCNGVDIFQYTEGYEHPKGDLFKDLMKGKTPWRFNEKVYTQAEYSFTLEEVEDIFANL